MPTYPDDTQWLVAINIKIDTVDPNTLPDTISGACPAIKFATTKAHVLVDNLQRMG